MPLLHAQNIPLIPTVMTISVIICNFFKPITIEEIVIIFMIKIVILNEGLQPCLKN